MPATTPFYDPDNKKLNEAIKNERNARNKTMERARRYRDGDHDRPLAQTPEGADDNIILNLVGQVVDNAVEFVGCPRIESEDELIRELINNNIAPNFDELFHNTLESGCVNGHVFLRIIPFADGDFPEIALIDPRFITVMWDASRVGARKSLLWYRLEWAAGEVTFRQDIVPIALLPVDISIDIPLDSWVIIESAKVTRMGRFEETGRDIWPYPFAPILDFKNKRRPHEYYGASDLIQTDLNDAVNFIASNTGKILKHHAHPRTIITGADIERMASTPDQSLFSFPDPNVRISNIEMQSDLASSLQFLNTLRSALFAAARVVDLASIRDKLGDLTNFSVRVLYLSMLDMATGKRELYAAGFEEAIRRALFIAGIEEAEINLAWDDPLPLDRLEFINAAEKESALGVVSRRTLAGELGRDFDFESERIDEEAGAQGARFADTLTRIGQAGGLP